MSLPISLQSFNVNTVTNIIHRDCMNLISNIINFFKYLAVFDKNKNHAFFFVQLYFSFSNESSTSIQLLMIFLQPNIPIQNIMSLRLLLAQIHFNLFHIHIRCKQKNLIAISALNSQTFSTQADVNHQVQHGNLFWRNRLVVPYKPTIIAQILHEFNASSV